MRVILALLAVMVVSYTTPICEAAPETKIYEIHEDLLLPFLKRAFENPEGLGDLISRMDEMNGDGKVRLIGDLKFREPTENEMNGVVVSSPITKISGDAIDYQVGGNWYNKVGARSFTMRRSGPEWVRFPAFELAFGHQPCRQWTVSGVVATVNGYLVVTERWDDPKAPDSASGWVVFPSPVSDVTLNKDKMPSLISEFGEWGVGSFLMRVPVTNRELARSMVKMNYQPVELIERRAKLPFSAEIVFYPEKKSLVSLNYSGAFFDKRESDGYYYNSSSWRLGVEMTKAVNVVAKKIEVTRRQHIEKSNGMTDKLVANSKKHLVQMTVIRDGLK